MKYTPSLRLKFTLSLLVTSLLSLLVAGLVARSILFREFNHVVMDESFRRFQSEMTVYLKKYGSWQKARQAESFRDFEMRRRPLYGGPPQQGLRAQTLNAASSPLTQEKERPPFRFMLTDPQGRVLMGGNKGKIGQLAPTWLRSQGKPIRVNGKTLAFALPDPQPNFNRLDLAYWQAMQQALMWAGIAAGLLALAMGVVVGTRLGRDLSGLTLAIQSVRKGQLRQRVRVQSRDEIGVLASAFNCMSMELAQAHEALQESHAKIEQQAQLLKELSIRDELTSLYNRRHFDEQAATMWAQAERYEHPLTFMVCDIDFFKRINDNFSHATGDEVLRRVSKLFKENTRESDIVARYGGEEFAIAFPQTSLSQAVTLCEKLRSLVEEYSWSSIHPDLRVTMSMGVCDDLRVGGFEKMIAAADEQLYRAKQNGRNRVCFSCDSPSLEYWPMELYQQPKFEQTQLEQPARQGLGKEELLR